MQSEITIPWDTIIAEINRVLVPGGYAQFTEFIYEHTCLSPLAHRKRAFPNSPLKEMEMRFTRGLLSTLASFFDVERRLAGHHYF